MSILCNFAKSKEFIYSVSMFYKLISFKRYIILSVVGLSFNANKIFAYQIVQDSTYLQKTLDQEIVSDYIFPEDYVFPEDTVIVDPAFMPILFTGKVLPEDYLKGNPYKYPELSDIREFEPEYTIPNDIDIFKKRKIKKEIDRKAYLYLLSKSPATVKYSSTDLPENPEIIEQLEVNPFKNLFKVEINPDFSHTESPEIFRFRKYWIINGNHLLQFSQNYISENWYKGGIGNLNILSNQNVKIDYAKEKIQFSSYLEWNTSLYTNPNDTLRKTQIGTDLLRSYSNFGFRAFGKQWFYSTNLEMKTQVFDNHKENTKTKISSFMAPLFVNMGIFGFRYELDKKFKKDKYKWLKLSADLSPLSVKYTYVGSPSVDPTRYGIPQGEDHLLNFGSLVNATMTFNINRSTIFKSRFKYFTSYDKIEIESENEMNFSVNRFFSTRIYLYLRYDDGENVPHNPTLGYLQINELLSFGFNYKW